MPSLTLPSVEQIRLLHSKHAPAQRVFELVFIHCQIVAEIALQLADSSGAKVDRQIVRAGCLLHDIGVYPLFDASGKEIDPSQYITHGTRGEEILRGEALPEALCRFASHHTGAGITKEQIINSNLPLPHKDYLAETTEEELVMYADKFHSKTAPPVFNSHDYYLNYVSRFGTDSVKSFEQLTAKFGKPDLKPLVAKYGYAVRN